jgi:GNAT superfamily N-acetyltransferase
MKIRKATLDDAAQLVPLVGQMGDKFKTNIDSMYERIRAFDKPLHQLLVAEEDGVILGAIAFGCFEMFRLAGRCCHVDTLIIDSKHRGSGIGKQLMAEAEKYAADNGCLSVELITANHRRPTGTHEVYKKIGYKDHLERDYSYFSKEENIGRSRL